MGRIITHATAWKHASTCKDVNTHCRTYRITRDIEGRQSHHGRKREARWLDA